MGSPSHNSLLSIFFRKHSIRPFVNSFVLIRSARGVMVIVVGNEHGDTSSNPGRD